MTHPYSPPTVTDLPLDGRLIQYDGNGYPPNWGDIATAVKRLANGRCEHCHHLHDIPSGHMLTVHHIDMKKGNCTHQNLVALCQKCHLRIQAQYRAGQTWIAGLRPNWATVRGL